jgi:hypothetical protein
MGAAPKPQRWEQFKGQGVLGKQWELDSAKPE